MNRLPLGRFPLVLSLAVNVSLALTTPSDAEDSESAVLVEDFSDVEQGDLPEGWNGPDALAVRKEGDRAWLEASKKGFHQAKSPKIALGGDFECTMTIQLEKGTSFKGSGVGVSFHGPNDEAMTIQFAQASPGIGFERWKVGLGDSSKVVDAKLGRAVDVGLIRKGRVFQLLVDRKVVIARRMSQFKSFDKVRIGVTGPENDRGSCVAKVHSISIEAGGAR